MEIEAILDYYKQCLELIHKRIQFLSKFVSEYDSLEKKTIPYFLGGVYFFHNNKNRIEDLSSIFLIPFEISSKHIINGVLAVLSESCVELNIIEVNKYLHDSRELLGELIFHHVSLEDRINKYNEIKNSPTKIFQRGELKRRCEELAPKYGLKKHEELTQDKIDLIITELKSENYDVHPESVAVVLRDKLKYKKDKN
ncbi:MAG: hypothetical protein M1480_13875 [Bacteroidetes bacterium]|nr:hypothetical protein [Bacteroidota bacterium]